MKLLGDSLITGSIACGATVAAAAACGMKENANAIAPVNATSHIIWGREAASAAHADMKHTLPGLGLNEGGSVFWATLYEAAFGRAAEKGSIGAAVLGGGAIAGLAYLIDYHLVPKRLTPGWEHRLSGRSLVLVYAALALSLPVRGLLRRTLR